jgi:hypothetical protein
MAKVTRVAEGLDLGPHPVWSAARKISALQPLPRPLPYVQQAFGPGRLTNLPASAKTSGKLSPIMSCYNLQYDREIPIQVIYKGIIIGDYNNHQVDVYYIIIIYYKVID